MSTVAAISTTPGKYDRSGLDVAVFELRFAAIVALGVDLYVSPMP